MVVGILGPASGFGDVPGAKGSIEGEGGVE